MNHIRILSRAFDITRFYRVLWIFGILLALTTANPGGNSGGSGGGPSAPNGNVPPTFDWPEDLPRFPPPSFDPGIVNNVIGIVIAVLCVVLILIVLFSIVRYVSHTAVIRMGNLYEASGEKLSFRQGWRMGWSRAAFRAWLVDLIVGLIGIVFVLLTLALAASPLALALTGEDAGRVIGIVMAVGLFFLMLLVWIVVFSVVGIWLQLSYRAIALENLGVFAGLGRGWGLFRRHLGDTIIMALIMFGISLVFAVLGFIIFFVLVLAGVAVAGIPALIAGFVTNLITQGGTPWMVGLLVGLPLLFLVVALPLLFVSGLYKIFEYNVWTLTFRELLALEATQPPTPPTQEPPASELELSV